jgi:hypothetical protein
VLVDLFSERRVSDSLLLMDQFAGIFLVTNGALRKRLLIERAAREEENERSSVASPLVQQCRYSRACTFGIFYRPVAGG